MKRILYVFCSKNYSGAEIVLERLIVANRAAVHPEALCPPGPFAKRLRRHGIVVHEEAALDSLERGKARRSKLKTAAEIAGKFVRVNRRLTNLLKQGYDAVHANNLPAAVYSLPTLTKSKLLGRPVKWIWSNHDLTYPGGGTNDRLAKLCNRGFDMDLVVSQAVADKFPGNPKVRVLYNGLDPKSFAFDQANRREIRERHTMSPDQVWFGIIGGISERKGHELLLEAFRELLPALPKAGLCIVGDYSPTEPEYESKIRALAKSIPSERIRFTGFIEDIGKFYSALDVVVNCSLGRFSEPLGTTVYEAMAAGRIVLASRTGGTPEIIDDGANGYLFQPDQSLDLSQKISYIYNNINSLERIREQGQETARTRFSLERMAKSYNCLLSSLAREDG